MFQICGVTPLPTEDNVCYQGMASDGCYYYLTEKCKENIIKLDKCFRQEETIPTCRIYSAICYDRVERCFWASARGCFSRLFKLNACLREVGEILLPRFCGEISGISYCCMDNSLLVSIGEKILRIDKSCPQDITELKNCPCSFITGVTSISPCYIYHFISGSERLFCVANKTGCRLETFKPPAGHIVKQLLYMGRCNEYDYFQILTLKHGCYPYVLEAKAKKSVLGEICTCNYVNQIDDYCPDNPGIEDCWHDSCQHDCCRHDCGGHGECCHDGCCHDGCCHDECCHDGCCHDECCHDGCCGDDCCHCNCHFPSCRHCNEVLESIALVETAIAHILNAEGEKIQKAIACTCCVDDLLNVNREVNKTIVFITNLEHALYAKLDALCECAKKTVWTGDGSVS